MKNKNVLITGMVLLAMLSTLFIPGMVQEVSAADMQFQVDGTRSQSSITITPGGNGDIITTITNKNTTDAMSVKMTVSGVATGYTVQFLNDSAGIQTTYSVPASSTVNVTVRTYLSDSLAGGSSDSFIVTATESSRGLTGTQTLTVVVGDDYTTSHYLLNTAGNKIYTDSELVPAGETCAFPVFVKNEGNTAIDTIYTTNTTGIPANWTVSIVDSLVTMTDISGHTSIPALSVRSFYVIVETDINDATGLTGEFTSRCVVSGQTSATITQENITYNVTIGASRSAPRWTVTGGSSQTASTQAVFDATLRNDNNVAMDTIFTVIAPKDSLGSALSGWTAVLYDDSGEVTGEWDSEDEVIASSGSPSRPFSISGVGSKDVFLVVNVSSSAVGGSKAYVNVLATFTSIATKGDYLNTNTTSSATTTTDTLPLEYLGQPWYIWLVGIVLVSVVILAIAGAYMQSKGKVRR